jgi:hypothetical protein
MTDLSNIRFNYMTHVRPTVVLCEYYSSLNTSMLLPLNT